LEQIVSTKTETLLDQARAIAPRLIEMRRHIHANPDLSFEEHETARYVAKILGDHGYTPRLVANGTGVIAETDSTAQGGIVAVRADMDGLPLEEDNPLPYCSRKKGVMHACGHDAHTACLLGAAILLAGKGTKLPGRVRFLFQPAEESINDEGKSGATLMIEEGALEGVRAAVALHTYGELETGKLALRSGPLLAACDTFKITIGGVGTHGAMPELGVDAIVLASHVVQAIQTIISRRKSALEPMVVTIGGIKSGTYRPNIVAEEVEIIGTARYFNADLLPFIKDELTRCCSIAEIMGGSFKLTYTHDNPVLANDQYVTQRVSAAITSLLGETALAEAPMVMGAEDFSFISAKVPSCFVFLGAEIKGDRRKFHTAQFDIDEAALPVGAAVLAQAALDLF
jgi:amidohydrolase